MKKKLALLLTVVMAFGLLVGCGSNEETTTTNTEANAQTSTNDTTATEQGTLADGNYFAAGEPDDKGYKYMISLDVNGGKIETVNFDAVNVNTAGDTKKKLSQDGTYGMKAGGASSEWHEQVELLEQALVEKQDVAAITVNEEGKTDAVSGVSIKVNNFVELVTQALEAGPVEAGTYKDGAYHAEEAEFDGGWKYTVDLTVFNGNIVAANWDAVNEEGGETKKAQSIAGTYGMDWHTQAQSMEQELIAKQDPAAITVKEDGTQDAVSGVSIKVAPFVTLAQEALTNAK